MKKRECKRMVTKKGEKRYKRNTQIKNAIIKIRKSRKASKQKRAQRFIKNSVAVSLTEITVSSAYFCHTDIIYHQD